MSLVRLLGFRTLTLRVRHRPLSRGGDEPRSDLRRRKGSDLRRFTAIAAITRSPPTASSRSRLARHQGVLSRGPVPCAVQSAVSVPLRRHLRAFPPPHTSLKSGRRPTASISATASTCSTACRPGSIDAIVTSPPYNLGIAVPQLRRHDAPRPVSRLDRRMGAAGRGGAVPARVAVPERRRQADRSVDGAGRRAGRAPVPPAAEHDSLDQVDRDRKGAGRQPGADSTRIWRSATTSRSTAGASCTTATSSSSTSRRTAIRRLDRQAIGVRYQDPSNVGRWRAAASGVRCRGNTWFIPYETIQNREKERPHPGDLSSQASGDVPAPARPRPDPVPSPIRSSASVRRRSRAPSLASASSASRWTQGYLKEAVARTRAAIR